jgi:hypothetical protein
MTMPIDLNANAVTAFHDGRLAERGWPREKEAPVATGTWHWVACNHLYNALLWHEEDKARRTDVAAEKIATSKRLIDQYNQARSDAIESLDESLLAALGRAEFPFGARLHSETPGAMVDRLSVLALKIFHMRAQAERRDARPDHITLCRNKLDRLTMQRNDLCGCLNSLLQDAVAGRAYFKVYRQFKMYNDPSLNPYLYAAPTAQSGKTDPFWSA